jgi:hypothetical protein
MFGLLELQSCKLYKDLRHYYSCNVCNTLASSYGRLSRLLLNDDSIFLSLLIDAQQNKIQNQTNTQKCRPWSKTHFVSQGFDYAAGISIVMGGVRIFDELEDEGSLRSKALSAIYLPKLRKAEKRLSQLGLNLPQIPNLINLQHQLETNDDKELDYYSHFTQEIYSKVFSHTAIIAGRPNNFEYLGEIGKNIGRIAYLIDDYVDFEIDKAKNQFNFFNTSKFSNRSKSGAVDNLKEILELNLKQSLKVIQENVPRVKLDRFEQIIKHLVTDGLKHKLQYMITNSCYLSRPMLFSAVPIILLMASKNILNTSSSCCCDIDCESICMGALTRSISRNVESIANTMSEGAVGAIIGGGSSVLISEIGSRIGRLPASQELQTEQVGVDQSQIARVSPASRSERIPRLDLVEQRQTSQERFNRRPALDQEHSDRVRRNILGVTYSEQIERDRRVEEDRKSRGLTPREEYEEIMRERPTFMDKFDLTIKGERHRLIQPPTNELLKLSDAQRQEYYAWRKKFDSYWRRHIPGGELGAYPVGSMGTVIGPRA